MQAYSPLQAYRVVDLAQLECQFCARLLADLGADVIKVEKPGGDPARNHGPFYHDIVDPEKSLFWYFFNAGKKGITLDIARESGQDLLRRLLRNTDFLIESFAPGHMDKLGLGYKAVSKVNPKIIYVSITPFGKDGPYAKFKASDLTLSAMGGLLYLTGDTDRPPVRISIPQSRLVGAVHAAMGALAALYFRNACGEGQLVDVSIRDAVTRISYAEPLFWQFERFLCRRQGTKTRRGGLEITEVWPCQDGQVCFRMMSGAYAGSMQALVGWMREEGMAGSLEEVKDWEHLDFTSFSQDRIDRWEKDLTSFFMKHTKKDFAEQAQKRKIYLAPAYNTREIAESEQLAAREFWMNIAYPELEVTINYPGPPFKTGAGVWGARCRAPMIGEHNREVFEGELVGLSGEELRRLKGQNII